MRTRKAPTLTALILATISTLGRADTVEACGIEVNIRNNIVAEADCGLIADAAIKDGGVIGLDYDIYGGDMIEGIADIDVVGDITVGNGVDLADCTDLVDRIGVVEIDFIDRIPASRTYGADIYDIDAAV